ncbi:MAG: M15 family metallopeptidase [Alphaproteobacteria bacterium]
MSLVRQQNIFLMQVAELIRKAAELGFIVSGGELYRTAEQQAIHLKAGRSKTLNSQHLKRLAIDLNFFLPAPDGALTLTYDVEALRPLGEYWESLDPANRWGGKWNFKDTPHFERQEAAADSVAAPAPLPATPIALTSPAIQTIASVAAGIWRGKGLLQSTVGRNGANLRDDVETVQKLLNLCHANNRLALAAPLKLDGAFGNNTLKAMMEFQRSSLGLTEPDGFVRPDDQSVKSMCESLPASFNAVLLGFIYLRAGEADIAEFAPVLEAEMASRNIDSPLRRAHFLAQVGHESGELRFRTEIASGNAYNGRADLGNDQPGDGPRFKGRGLIQLTGRANYNLFGRAIGREAEIMADPDIVGRDLNLCVRAAGWFWESRHLNSSADRNDLNEITRRVNGGFNGLEDRRRLLKRAMALL